MNVVGVAGLVCAAALVTAAAVPLVRRLALAWGAIDVPGGRGVTVKPTARLGGLAIFRGTALVLSVAGLFGWVPFTRSSFAVAPFVIGALLVIGVGVVDDFHRLRPHVKLVVEIVAALIVVTVAQHIHHRLLTMGLGQRRVVWALYTVQAIACAIAVYRFVNQ